MMGFHAASGLVSVILQVIVDSIVFCLLFCSAIQTYMKTYMKTGILKLRRVEPCASCLLQFRHNQAFYKAHHRAIPEPSPQHFSPPLP